MNDQRALQDQMPMSRFPFRMLQPPRQMIGGMTRIAEAFLPAGTSASIRLAPVRKVRPAERQPARLAFQRRRTGRA
jgi:hypothetical protein